MLQAAKDLVPPMLRPLVRRLAFLPLDLIDSLFGSRDPLIPPRGLMYDGPANAIAFREDGDRFLKLCRAIGGLQPHHRILDVGSGMGRKTRPLMHFLNEQGSYQGIEIVRRGVRWCQERIASRDSRFAFQHVDVFNKYYNRHGKILSTEFAFPFPDGEFDFVMLGSVFTHMFPDDISHYISEIARVTKTGGRCLASYFLSNDEAEQRLRENKTLLKFVPHGPGYLTTNPAVPEAAVCVPEEFIRATWKRYGMEIMEPIRFGSWSGREGGEGYQDVIVVEKGR